MLCLSGEFPYAKCFICGETGHLSRTCPDNPKGLYAQGIKILTNLFRFKVHRYWIYYTVDILLIETEWHVINNYFIFAGGCCRVCGSVEHFQKDCPEHQAASESPLHSARLREEYDMYILWQQLELTCGDSTNIWFCTWIHTNPSTGTFPQSCLRQLLVTTLV